MGAPDGHNPESRGDPTASPGRSSAVDRALIEFTDDARRDLGRRSRIERSDREVVAGLSATFLGTLVELSETAAPAVFITSAGTHHRGLVAAVGRDVVVLRSGADGRRTLLAPAAIEAVRETRNLRSRDISTIAAGPRLGDLLDQLAEDGGRVTITTFGGNRFMGSLMAVGADQVGLRLDGENDVLTIPLASIAEAVTER